jgi:hypothetical protein
MYVAVGFLREKGSPQDAKCNSVEASGKTRIAPKANEELILHKGLEHLYPAETPKEAREFLADIDKVLAEPDESNR